jgi:hypothetical protein
VSALVCPSCLSPDKLWTDGTFQGWHDVKVIFRDGRIINNFDGDSGVEPRSFQSDGNYGCSTCDWSGSRRELVRLGTDGQPLAEPIPGQGSLPL